ncbi:hypothetical protein SAMN04487995_2578 [Dyadobacter koreensis]|uniref:Uncharacterized protein n=1 Tax=Dyadobacter koreensis TaxID=408657 RepID=A0A1H6US35_9BACT|nr:hypothetical protein SAMN04487995_2578 [Dyadobacter koreensis]
MVSYLNERVFNFSNQIQTSELNRCKSKDYPVSSKVNSPKQNFKMIIK